MSALGFVMLTPFCAEPSTSRPSLPPPRAAVRASVICALIPSERGGCYVEGKSVSLHVSESVDDVIHRMRELAAMDEPHRQSKRTAEWERVSFKEPKP